MPTEEGNEESFLDNKLYCLEHPKGGMEKCGESVDFLSDDSLHTICVAIKTQKMLLLIKTLNFQYQ
jgi:hypothetical protein